MGMQHLPQPTMENLQIPPNKLHKLQKTTQIIVGPNHPIGSISFTGPGVSHIYGKSGLALFFGRGIQASSRLTIGGSDSAQKLHGLRRLLTRVPMFN